MWTADEGAPPPKILDRLGEYIYFFALNSEELSTKDIQLEIYIKGKFSFRQKASTIVIYILCPHAV